MVINKGEAEVGLVASNVIARRAIGNTASLISYIPECSSYSRSVHLDVA